MTILFILQNHKIRNKSFENEQYGKKNEPVK